MPGPLSPTPPVPGRPHGGDRLRRLTDRLGLGALDEAILLLALAPDLDRTFEPLYGYLNDDVSRRRATVGPAIELCGLPVHDAVARARFHPSAPLVALGLVRVEETERPFLGRSLRVPDRVTAHLLGDDTPDAALAGQVALLPPRPAETAPPGGSLVRHLAGRLTAGRLTAYLREEREGDALSCATAALAAAGMEALHFTPDQGSSRDTAAAEPHCSVPGPGRAGHTGVPLRSAARGAAARVPHRGGAGTGETGAPAPGADGAGRSTGHGSRHITGHGTGHITGHGNRHSTGYLARCLRAAVRRASVRSGLVRPGPAGPRRPRQRGRRSRCLVGRARTVGRR